MHPVPDYLSESIKCLEEFTVLKDQNQLQTNQRVKWVTSLCKMENRRGKIILEISTVL